MNNWLPNIYLKYEKRVYFIQSAHGMLATWLAHLKYRQVMSHKVDLRVVKIEIGTHTMLQKEMQLDAHTYLQRENTAN